jgi:cysteine desulfurase
MRLIYADNAATTPVSEEAFAAMEPFFRESFGNPSSLYSVGRRARKALESAREETAACLNAAPEELFFTSGGSESDNWALKGIAFSQKARSKNHIVTSKFEHHAVLHACSFLESEGFEVTYLDVHEDGIIRPEELEAMLRPGTALVSVMFANNEIGTVQPVREIGEICRRHGVLFHTDAVQAAGTLPIDLNDLKIDLLSLSAHKFYGPKGTGSLYIRRGTEFANLIDGGAQERSRRAGTENVAGAVGLAAALKASCENREEHTARLNSLRDRLTDGLLKIEGTRLNGDRIRRLPGNINIAFDGVDGETLVLMLDQAGICASSGSACTAGSSDPSHVLRAIGLPPALAVGSLRLTLGARNTEEDVDAILGALPPIVGKIRAAQDE